MRERGEKWEKERGEREKNSEEMKRDGTGI